MTKIICISDCHGQYANLSLPAGDVLIDAGDWTADDDYRSICDYLAWMNAQPHEHKVIVPGNHQTWVEANPDQFMALKDIVAPSVIYLNDSGTEIAGLKMWGSGYTPVFFDWAFNVERGPAIQAHWDLIPTDTQVLITHGPAMGILDKTREGHFGCANLATTIRERLKSLVLHQCGHFHGPGGQVEIVGGVMHVNASVVNERYVLTNQPVVVNL